MTKIHIPRGPKVAYTALKETPLDNRIVVLEDAIPSETKGGILLPAESQSKPYTGIALAVGPNCQAIKLHNQVRYSQRAGDKIEIDGVEYLMLRETDCYTILNK
jgi:chaperonin GroES